MSSKKLITVFGATGNQGGSIVSVWASDKNLQSKYSIRAITRDTTKDSAKALAAKGAETVSADINDPSSLAKAIAGSYAVFGVTNYWETMSKDKEFAQGKSIADASFSAGVKHIIFSTLPHTTKLTNGQLPQIDHFVAKAEVGEYIEANKAKSSAWATYYEPGFFMSNFGDMGIINPGQDGKLTLTLPYAATAQMGLIDIKAETGRYVWGAIEAGAGADGKFIQAVSEWVTTQKIVDTLSEYGGAGEIKFTQIPRETFKGFLVEKMGDYVAEEMTQNMELIGDWSYYGKGAEKNQGESDTLLYGEGGKTSFKEFVEKKKPWKFGAH